MTSFAKDFSNQTDLAPNIDVNDNYGKSFTINNRSGGDLLVEIEIMDVIGVERTKLQENEVIREEIWAQFFPFLIIAILLYAMLSSFWIAYNCRVYETQKRRASHGQRSSNENRRLLQRYEQIPIDIEIVSPTSSTTVFESSSNSGFRDKTEQKSQQISSTV